MNRTTRRFRQSLLAAAALALSVACGGQVGEEKVGCEAVSSDPVALTDVTPLGFRAADVLAIVEGAHTAPVRWADGRTGTLSLEVVSDGTAAFVDYEWRDDGSGAEIQTIGCDDVVDMPVAFTLTSDDSALSESGTLVVSARSQEAGSLLLELTDTFDEAPFVPDGEWSSVSSWIELTIDEGGVTGSIDGQAAGEDGDVAFAQGFDIAEVGAEPQ